MLMKASVLTFFMQGVPYYFHLSCCHRAVYRVREVLIHGGI